MERVEEEREAIWVESMEADMEEEEWEEQREGTLEEEEEEEKGGEVGMVEAVRMEDEAVDTEDWSEVAVEEEETTGVAFAVEVAEREEGRQEVAEREEVRQEVRMEGVEAIAEWERGAMEERVVSEAAREGPDRRVEVQTVRHRRWSE